MRPSVALVFGFAACSAVSASSAEDADPWLQIEVPAEMQFDATVSPRVARLNELYLTVEPSVALRAASWLSFELGTTFEAISEATGDRAFDDHGLYLATAQALASFGPVTIGGGKFSPNFSIGFELTPGLNGDTFNGDAEIAERIGLRASYNLAGEGSAAGIIVSAAAFRRDTSVFSDSLLQSRGRLRIADGGPGNHSGLESYAFAVDVIEPDWAPGLHLHAGYLHQQAGLGDTADAKAWVAGANWIFGGAGEGRYQILAEWARAEDSVGFGDAVSAKGASQSVATLAFGGTWADAWTAAVATGLRDSDVPLSGSTRDWFVQLTAGYFVSEDLSVELGWQRADDGTEVSDTVSLRIASGFSYALE